MSLFSNLPEDIKLHSLLSYIPLENLDAYCLQDEELHERCLDPKIMERYLRSHGLGYALKSPRFGLEAAAGIGSIILTEFFLRRGATNYSYAMAHAAEKGHQNIVNWMLDLGDDNYEYDYDTAMAVAAYGGHQEIINQMIALGARSYNRAMERAAAGGHQDIVNQMLDLGADDYNNTLISAAFHGYAEIVNQMLDLGADNYYDAAREATIGGHPDIAKIITEYRQKHPYKNRLRK